MNAASTNEYYFYADFLAPAEDIWREEPGSRSMDGEGGPRILITCPPAAPSLIHPGLPSVSWLHHLASRTETSHVCVVSQKDSDHLKF